MDRYTAQYYDRLKAESAARYLNSRDDDPDGWKPWMRKAKPPVPEGRLCPTCRTKRSLTGECYCV